MNRVVALIRRPCLFPSVPLRSWTVHLALRMTRCLVGRVITGLSDLPNKLDLLCLTMIATGGPVSLPLLTLFFLAAMVSQGPIPPLGLPLSSLRVWAGKACAKVRMTPRFFSPFQNAAPRGLLAVALVQGVVAAGEEEEVKGGNLDSWTPFLPLILLILLILLTLTVMGSMISTKNNGKDKNENKGNGNDKVNEQKDDNPQREREDTFSQTTHHTHTQKEKY